MLCVSDLVKLASLSEQPEQHKTESTFKGLESVEPLTDDVSIEWTVPYSRVRPLKKFWQVRFLSDKYESAWVLRVAPRKDGFTINLCLSEAKIRCSVLASYNFSMKIPDDTFEIPLKKCYFPYRKLHEVYHYTADFPTLKQINYIAITLKISIKNTYLDPCVSMDCGGCLHTRSLYPFPNYYDLIFISCDGERTTAFQSILMKSSRLFKSMFAHSAGRYVKNVVLERHDLRTVCALLEFVHFKTFWHFEGMDDYTLFELMEIGMVFRVEELVSITSTFVIPRINEENVLDLLFKAHEHTVHKLKKKCLDFVRDNKSVFCEEVLKAAFEESEELLKEVLEIFSS